MVVGARLFTLVVPRLPLDLFCSVVACIRSPTLLIAGWVDLIIALICDCMGRTDAVVGVAVAVDLDVTLH